MSKAPNTTAAPGVPFPFILRATNTGTGPIPDPTIIEPFPEGIDYVPGTTPYDIAYTLPAGAPEPSEVVFTPITDPATGRVTPLRWDFPGYDLVPGAIIAVESSRARPRRDRRPGDREPRRRLRRTSRPDVQQDRGAATGAGRRRRAVRRRPLLHLRRPGSDSCDRCGVRRREGGERTTLYTGTIEVASGERVTALADDGNPVLLPMAARCWGTEARTGGASQVTIDADSFDTGVAVLPIAGRATALDDLGVGRLPPHVSPPAHPEPPTPIRR